MYIFSEKVNNGFEVKYMKFNKIDVKSKSFVTLVACCAIALGAVGMVAVVGNQQRVNNETTTAQTEDANARKSDVKKTTTKPVVSTTEGTTQSTTVAPSEGVSMDANDNNVPYKSFFSYPLSEVVNKDFSNGNLVYSITMGDYRSHNGTDFDGKDGDPVKAINAGLVLSVTKDEMWGTVVEIDHGNKMVVKYCGLKETKLIAGTTVAQNDQIGPIGAIPIEAADGTHLHLEVRIDSKLVNPVEAMNKMNLE